MDVQVFTQAAVVFIISVTFTNIVISFMQLCVEELKKCSIMDGEKQKKKVMLFAERKQKKYAVLQKADKFA